MQTIFNSKVKETLYVEKLKNGLTVMIIPKKHTMALMTISLLYPGKRSL